MTTHFYYVCFIITAFPILTQGSSRSAILFYKLCFTYSPLKIRIPAQQIAAPLSFNPLHCIPEPLLRRGYLPGAGYPFPLRPLLRVRVIHSGLNAGRDNRPHFLHRDISFTGQPFKYSFFFHSSKPPDFL